MKYREYTNKMHWLMVAFVAVLFVALTPGVLVTLPPRSSKLVVAATHGVLFALVYHFTHHAVWMFLYGGKEGADKTLHKKHHEEKKKSE
jgi:hypothetical protein